MASCKYDDDDDDNAEVTSKIPETAEQTDKQTSASPWVLSKARLRISAGKKHASKSSKRVAGGGKTKKKGASNRGAGGQQQTSEVRDDGARRPSVASNSKTHSSTAARDDRASLTSTDANKAFQRVDTKQEAAKKADELLQETVNSINDEEMIPTVNGMRQFGISKGVISRAIVRFSSPPQPHPLTVCFQFPGVFLTHKYVLEMLRGRLKAVSNARVTVIQFVDRNTIHGTKGLDNRWIVTLNCDEAKEQLLSHGLNVFNKKIKVRSYDDILNEEYVEYQQYQQMQKKLFLQKRQLAADGGASRVDGDELSDTEGGWEHQDDELLDDRGLHAVDPQRGPPTTAANTPEPPYTTTFQLDRDITA